MKARGLALLSMGLNVGLLAGIWRVARPADPAPAADAAASLQQLATTRFVSRTNVARVEVTLTNHAPAFRWDQIQSDDLTQYVAGLRRLECPEETIRDIIRGELSEQYLARRRLVLDPWQRKYWDLAVHGFDQAKEEFKPELEKLKKETLERLDDVVGKPADTNREPSQLSRPDPRFDFLSEEKQRQLAALNEQFDQLERGVPRENGPASEDRRARLKALKDQRLEAARALLTPAEFEEYRLRNSPYASRAKQLAGFDATVDEMRTMTRIYEQFEAAQVPLDRKDPAFASKSAARKAAQQQRDDALKTALGEARYQDMRRGESGSFQQVHQVAERYGLPREAAVQVDDLRRVALDNLRQVRGNNTLSAEQRAEMLRAITAESRAAVWQALGEQAARTYERNGGEWLQDKP